MALSTCRCGASGPCSRPPPPRPPGRRPACRRRPRRSERRSAAEGRLIGSATSRVTVSVGPPAANGTTNVIGPGRLPGRQTGLDAGLRVLRRSPTRPAVDVGAAAELVRAGTAGAGDQHDCGECKNASSPGSATVCRKGMLDVRELTRSLSWFASTWRTHHSSPTRREPTIQVAGTTFRLPCGLV